MSVGARLDYRPTTYWDVPDVLLANIKGEHRRQMIKRLAVTGHLADLDARWVAESLTEDERTALAEIHPRLMGGEYLPDYPLAEVEIARVCLTSFKRPAPSGVTTSRPRA